MCDVIGRDQFFRQRQSGRPDADLGKGASTRRNDGPAVVGKAGQQGERAGQRDDAFEIFDFAALDLAVLGFMIGVRQVFTHRRETGAAMGAGNYFFGIESVLNGPSAPDTRHRGSGVDEDSVHVEEESGAVDLGHRSQGKSLAATTSCGWMSLIIVSAMVCERL